MHHNIFNNPFVRLLDVRIAPGDTTQFHIHGTPSVFIILQSVRTGSQVMQEENHSDSPVSHFGNIWFEGFYKTPRIHRVWNSDTSEFHVMDIELLRKTHLQSDPPIQDSALQFLFDAEPVRVYRLKLPAASGKDFHSARTDILIIKLTDSKGMAGGCLVNYKNPNEYKKALVRKGDYGYIQSGNPFRIKNNEAKSEELAVLELK